MYMRLPVFLVVIIASLLSDAAMAQSAAWSKEGVDLIERLTSGIIPIATGILGLAVMIAGVIMALMGKAEWARIGWIIAGGFLVMVGPATLGLLLKLPG